MNVLILADVVARPGRRAVLDRIQDLREQYEIDVALMNAENVAGGFSSRRSPTSCIAPAST
jgi:2',3'-cyclic-nucleotide 2'-phosphodiesterase